MYILALLFGLVNFYFLASAIVVITGLLIEYILVPLINSGSQILKLHVYYSIQKTNDPQPNIMSNTFHYQNKIIGSDKSNNTNEATRYVKKQEPNVSQQTQSVDTIQTQSDNETCSLKTTNIQEKTPLDKVKKSNGIVIDESLD